MITSHFIGLHGNTDCYTHILGGLGKFGGRCGGLGKFGGRCGGLGGFGGLGTIGGLGFGG